MYFDLEKEPTKTKEIIGPFLKRWSPYVLKIAILMEAVSDPDSDIIRPESIAAAFSVVEYAIKSTIFLFKNELGESEQQRKQRIVLEYIAKRGGAVVRKQLIASKILDGGANEYDYVLGTLMAMGKIDYTAGIGGTKNIVYKLCVDWFEIAILELHSLDQFDEGFLTVRLLSQISRISAPDRR